MAHWHTTTSGLTQPTGLNTGPQGNRLLTHMKIPSLRLSQHLLPGVSLFLCFLRSKDQERKLSGVLCDLWFPFRFVLDSQVSASLSQECLPKGAQTPTWMERPGLDVGVGEFIN